MVKDVAGVPEGDACDLPEMQIIFEKWDKVGADQFGGCTSAFDELASNLSGIKSTDGQENPDRHDEFFFLDKVLNGVKGKVRWLSQQGSLSF
jgi:hypothetical protein